MSQVASPAAPAPPVVAPRHRNRWLAFLALAVAGAAFLVVTVGGIGKNLVYYWGPTELHAAGERAFGVLFLMIGLITLRTRVAALRLRSELAPPPAETAPRAVVPAAGEAR